MAKLLTFLSASLLSAALVVAGENGQDKSVGKNAADQPKNVPDQATVKKQIDKAQEYYKEVLEVDKVPVHEAAHFIIVGQSPGKTPPLVAADVELAYVKACEILELEKDPGPWSGKLVILLLPDAKHYPRMIRITQRRRADEDECGSHSTSATLAHVAVCPGKAPTNLGVSGTACAEVASLLVTHKAKTQLPMWLSEGFGRATALHIGPANTLAAERRKATALFVAGKRTANDVFTDNLNGEEFPVLRGSLVDYLAYSGRTAKFLPFVQGFAGDAKNNNGGIDLALKNANFTRETLTSNWERYVKGLK